MAIGVAVLIVAILILAIWFIVAFKRVRHKIFAIFLIALILFTYLSFTLTLKSQDIDYTSVAGLVTAGKIYLSWLGTIFGNFKSITTHAISLDWTTVNQTVEDKLDISVKDKS